jgi:hypothetical protein
LLFELTRLLLILFAGCAFALLLTLMLLRLALLALLLFELTRLLLVLFAGCAFHVFPAALLFRFASLALLFDVLLLIESPLLIALGLFVQALLLAFAPLLAQFLFRLLFGFEPLTPSFVRRVLLNRFCFYRDGLGLGGRLLCGGRRARLLLRCHGANRYRRSGCGKHEKGEAALIVRHQSFPGTRGRSMPLLGGELRHGEDDFGPFARLKRRD